jgi:hypothetical protein
MFSFIDDDRSGKTADEGWYVFYTRLEDLLTCMIKNNATLRAKKTRIGFESTVFYGFEIKHGKTTTAEKNLTPIRTMMAPKCKADVRRVLGIFVQAKNWVPNYAARVKPLTDLLRKAATFKWGSEQQLSFKFMREHLLSRPWLHPVDLKRPVHIDVDASQYAMGACVYQINKDDGTQKDVIMFASKAFDDDRHRSYTTASPFYREARAVAHFLKMIQPLVALSPFPVHVHSDHMPLKWMKQSRRGPIADFVVFDLGGMYYRIHYKPGKTNIIADALSSRFPLVSPNDFHLRGLIAALKVLLDNLSEKT